MHLPSGSGAESSALSRGRAGHARVGGRHSKLEEDRHGVDVKRIDFTRSPSTSTTWTPLRLTRLPVGRSWPPVAVFIGTRVGAGLTELSHYVLAADRLRKYDQFRVRKSLQLPFKE